MKIEILRLVKLPQEVSSQLQKMINYLVNMDLSVNLPFHKSHQHIFEVYDRSNQLKCFFKILCNDQEESTQKEVDVYLLDHPPNSRRSVSLKVYGFSGVYPTVLGKFTCVNEMMMGVLMDFVEDAFLIHQRPHQPISNMKIQKNLLVDIRFGTRITPEITFFSELKTRHSHFFALCSFVFA
ncbi:unnamed protein product [Brassica rapa]|uniref:Uncharacterized protein n=1 Tax=Brassica campestris TaxID=3711 RepID=A0A3P5YJK6_BRACM|nr:unnamed protein product [Brassica rapa]VDC67872.1 unnamed protein product [Brassica rapa]